MSYGMVKIVLHYAYNYRVPVSDVKIPDLPKETVLPDFSFAYTVASSNFYVLFDPDVL